VCLFIPCTCAASISSASVHGAPPLNLIRTLSQPLPLTLALSPFQARGMNGFRESDAVPSNDDDNEEHGEEDDRSHRSNPSPGHSHHRGHHYASTNRCLG